MYSHLRPTRSLTLRRALATTPGEKTRKGIRLLRCKECERSICPCHTSTGILASRHTAVENCVKNCSINENLWADSLIFQSICRCLLVSQRLSEQWRNILSRLKNYRPYWMISLRSFRSTVFSFSIKSLFASWPVGRKLEFIHTNIPWDEMTGYRMIKEKGRAIRKSRDLTQQDVWKTQDGRITKTSRARLCIPGLTRHFPVILPSSCVRSLLRKVPTRDLKSGRRQRQRRHQKTMIWLVEWGKIIVLHVRQAL